MSLYKIPEYPLIHQFYSWITRNILLHPAIYSSFLESIIPQFPEKEQNSVKQEWNFLTMNPHESNRKGSMCFYYQGLNLANGPYDFEKELKSIKIKYFKIIHGEFDMTVNVKTAQDICDKIPTCELTVLKDEYHISSAISNRTLRMVNKLFEL